jgi:hypothetical protein|nr:MAG TPA: hypothetical protein [Caudoviricetes sp.]
MQIIEALIVFLSIELALAVLFFGWFNINVLDLF